MRQFLISDVALLRTINHVDELHSHSIAVEICSPLRPSADSANSSHAEFAGPSARLMLFAVRLVSPPDLTPTRDVRPEFFFVRGRDDPFDVGTFHSWLEPSLFVKVGEQ